MHQPVDDDVEPVAAMTEVGDGAMVFETGAGAPWLRCTVAVDVEDVR